MSPDGWTREFDVQVPVSDPDPWRAQADTLSRARVLRHDRPLLFTLTTGTSPLREAEGSVAASGPQQTASRCFRAASTASSVASTWFKRDSCPTS